MSILLVSLHSGVQKFGDVIAILPSGHIFGDMEVTPNFGKIHLLDISQASGKKEYFDTISFGSGMASGSRYIFKIEVNNLAAAVKTKLTTNSSGIEIGAKTGADLKQKNFDKYVYDKVTQATKG